MSEHRPRLSALPRTSRLVVGIAGFWVFVTLLAGVQGIVARRFGGGPVFDFPASVKASLVWLLLTLGAAELARRFPLRGPGWPRRVALHLGASSSVTFVLEAGIRILDEVTGSGSGFGTLDGYLASSVRWLHINALVYWTIVGAAHAWNLLREREADELGRARLEAELAQAELGVLRAQLHPHFLFNALHTVGLLWRTNRGEEAQEVMERLSRLLRRVTDPDRPQEITLAEEMELVREYLAIEKVRFRDRLSLEERLDPESLSARVPSLILQPLVENAVRHGVEGRAGAGRVTVESERTPSGSLEVRVRDDGPGPRAHWSDGTGISNTRERLVRLYGDEQELTLTAAGGSGGTLVRLRIPFRESPAPDATATSAAAEKDALT